MKEKQDKKRILILGGSGFIGNALYKELHSYYDVHATYCHQIGNFSENHVFHKFCIEEDFMFLLLKKVRPTVIISALKGDYRAQFEVHQDIRDYVRLNKNCQVLFLSSAAVFDAKPMLPSYENDFPQSQTELGKFKISIEKMMLESIPEQISILRLPMVLGINSPAIFHLRQCIRHKATFDLYPNLVVTATTISKICQQVHYIINKSMRGIFHLASNDMIHHEELFKEITTKISDKMPIFKNVFSSNEDRYNALLPKYNRLLKTYQITIAEVIEESCLNEAIESIS